MTRRSFEEITVTLATDAGLTIRERALFHAFNPRGAVADWRDACAEISRAVDDGVMKSGAVLAYGSLNDFHERGLMQQVRRTRAARFHVDYAIRGLREAAATARAKATEARKAAEPVADDLRAVDDMKPGERADVLATASHVAPDFAWNARAVRVNRDRDGFYFTGRGLGCSRTYPAAWGARRALAAFAAENGATLESVTLPEDAARALAAYREAVAEPAPEPVVTLAALESAVEREPSFAAVKRELRAHGFRVTRIDGEIRVGFAGNESAAYYTDSPSDALATGLAMLRERAPEPDAEGEAIERGEHVPGEPFEAPEPATCSDCGAELDAEAEPHGTCWDCCYAVPGEPEDGDDGDGSDGSDGSEDTDSNGPDGSRLDMLAAVYSAAVYRAAVRTAVAIDDSAEWLCDARGAEELDGLAYGPAFRGAV